MRQVKTRLHPILPLSLAGGAFLIQFTSGCTTERIVHVHDVAGNGMIIPGATGGAGGGGGRGAGGSAGGATGPSPIGKSCLQDSDCKSGLTCLTAGSDAFNPGGPAGGLCTIPCGTSDSGDPDADCTAIDKNSVCVGFDTQNGISFCLQKCTEGVSSATKCQGRSDMTCSPLVDQNGNPTFAACQPACGSDFDCAGRKCDFRTGMCVAKTSGSLPIGSPCDPDATPDPCNGFCVNFYGSQDAAASKYGVCFGVCSLNVDGVGCGVDPTSQPPFDVQCLGPSTSAAGDQGLCFQLCDCNDDCLNKAFICRPWGDTQSVDATGRKGYCRGPVDDTGKPVTDLKCSATGTGGTGAGGAAGAGGASAGGAADAGRD
jgi:hypothetical protein